MARNLSWNTHFPIISVGVKIKHKEELFCQLKWLWVKNVIATVNMQLPKLISYMIQLYISIYDLIGIEHGCSDSGFDIYL